MTRFITILLLCSTLVSSAFIPQPAPLAITKEIYTDALASGWSDWSWASVNLAAASPAHSGTHSISVTFDGWEGLYLHNAGANPLGTTHLRFYLHGGTSGGQQMDVKFTLEINGSTVNGPAIAVTQPQAGVWSEVSIPLTSLNPNNEQVSGIIWQSSVGSTQSAVYFDDIALVSTEDPNAPQIGSFSISPRSIPADGLTQIVIKATLSDPQGLGNITQVSLDGSALGRGSIPLLDDGRSNDGAAHDGIYGAAFSAAGGTPRGEYQLLLNAVDAQSHTTSQPLGAITVLATTGGSIPDGLPQRVSWGSNQWSENQGQDWQVNSGVPWDYVYQYITYGWETWGDNFVYRFVHQAWDKGYIPAVTVYMMLGTPPNAGCESAACYADKLTDSGMVNSYIASLQRAAQQVSGDQPVIFIMEPDFYGFMQQHCADPYTCSPAAYPVALNRSGYANNLVGFGRYIVDLIHQTAPNALVAPEASMWSTNNNPQGVTAAQAINMAQSTAAFIDAMGGAQSDLLIVEFSDRDAGFYEVLQGRDTWWDDTDMELPRVTRAFLWENALSQASGKRLLLWQVPVGNMSLDNTDYHYKDNRASYLFNHPRDFFDTGVIGVMFGGGAQYCTNVNTDGGFVQSQGVIAYNPPPAPTNLTAGLPGGIFVQLRWDEVTINDLWSYRVHYRLAGQTQDSVRDVSRQNSSTLLLPTSGNWQIWVTSRDAMGLESPPSNLVTVTTTVNSEQVFLPLLNR
jgi:hypothetical protein